MIRAIVFDFDGVIVRNSEFIKESAWEKVFDLSSSENSERLREAKNKYSQGRGTRFEIIHHILEAQGVPKEKLEEGIEKAAKKYNLAVQKGILELKINPKDQQALSDLSKKYTLFVNSATPLRALRETLLSLSISEFFTEAYGGEHSKTENMKQICEKGFNPREIVFVGDGENDARTAESVGCTFVAVLNDWNKWDSDKFRFAVKEIAELPRIMGQIK